MNISYDAIVIVYSCAIQVVIWASLVYGYKYCFKDIGTSVDEVNTLLKTDLLYTRVSQLDYATYKQNSLLFKLSRYDTLNTLIVAMDIILIVIFFSIPAKLSTVSTVLFIFTQLCVFYNILLMYLLNKVLVSSKKALSERKDELEVYSNQKLSSYIFR